VDVAAKRQDLGLIFCPEIACQGPRMNMHLKWNCGQGAALAATLVLGALVPCVSAAAEGGGSNYMPGTYGDFGAGMSPPSYLRNDVIFYEAGIGPRPINGGLDPGFEQDLWMDRLTLGGFMDSGSSGAKFGIELQIPYVFDLTVTQNPGGPPFNSFASPRDHAFGDPTIKPQIAWGAGPHYGKVSVGVVAPWGTHDEGNVLSVGRHYWSFVLLAHIPERQWLGCVDDRRFHDQSRESPVGP
jgi:hypothetical protein